MRRTKVSLRIVALCTILGLPLALILLASPVRGYEVRCWVMGFVLFDFGKADIRPDAQKKLSEIAYTMRNYPEKIIIITGLIDQVEDEDYDRLLSLRRAIAVKQWLQEQKGLKEKVFVCVGSGVSNTFYNPKEGKQTRTAAGRQKSRRVVIILVENVSEGRREFDLETTRGILFDFDKHDLRPDALEVLRTLVMVIRLNLSNDKDNIIFIEGHTDSVGEREYNQKLSLRRAEAVKLWLTKEREEYIKKVGHAYEGQKMEFRATGWGESKPIATNDTAAGRQKNRRVEITILQ